MLERAILFPFSTRGFANGTLREREAVPTAGCANTKANDTDEKMTSFC
ncbi:MAG: hypothetical protein LH613_17425 [Chamaesiphon sp.]|nr:hypothetical protein [Chamaesiphon sp.]